MAHPDLASTPLLVSDRSLEGPRVGRVLSMFLWLWLATGAVGFLALNSYTGRPGQSSRAKLIWPAYSSIQRLSTQGTLVLFANPSVPGAEASVAEIERLLPELSGKVQTKVVLFDPGQLDQDWHGSPLWKKTASLPDVEVIGDPNGRETYAFGTRRSGQIFLYDERGKLVFSGGLAPTPGLVVKSEGWRAVQAYARGYRSLTQR